MTHRAVPIIAMLAVLAGCGQLADSRLNPFNWFGGSRADRVALGDPAADPRPLVDQVIAMQVDPAPGGAILRAVGLPPRQGFWDAALLEDPRDGDTLSFQFRLQPPPRQTRVSTQQSREVVVAVFLSDQKLAGVREIRVLGARESRTVRR